MAMLKLLVFAPVMLAAQSFETASIKPSEPGVQCQGGLQSMTGGGLRAVCVNLKTLLTWAYQVQNYQVTGGPAWVESINWNILAKGPSVEGAIEVEKMTDQQRQQHGALVKQRLQKLLADRFQLVLRRESREQPIYALTVGKDGPKLQESENQAKAGFLRRGNSELLSRGSLLDTVAQFLAIDLGRPVANRTGLTAHYDFELHWNNETGPTLFTAIQDLGLKLESAKGPVDMLVIERAEKPSDN